MIFFYEMNEREMQLTHRRFHFSNEFYVCTIQSGANAPKIGNTRKTQYS